MRRLLLIAPLLLALSGCGDPTIDGSSDEAMKNSIAKVRSSLPEAERGEFDKAVMTVGMGEGNLFQMAAAGKDVMVGQMRSRLDGKSAKEILQLAGEIRAKRKQEMAEADAKHEATKAEAAARAAKAELERLAKRIEELKQLRASDAAAAEVLTKFTISDTAITQDKDVLDRNVVTLHMQVHNGTATAVSRVFMTGTVYTEGRSVPWLVKGLNYQVAGGIEPGETKTWKLSPNQFSDWGKLEVTPDMRLRLQVTELEGPDGVSFAKLAFGEEERTQLARLEAELADATKSAAKSP